MQINHAVTSAVRRIPVLMEGHAPSCTTTPNKSSTAHTRLDMLENFVGRRKVLHLASSYNSKQRSQIILHTMYDPAVTLSTKPSAISLLQMDSFGLYSSPSALPANTISRLSPFSKITQWSETSFACVTTDNEFNAEQYYALPSNLQLQHWWTGNNRLLKSQDNWSEHPAAKQWNISCYDCYNCTAKMSQKSWHLYTLSYHGYPCQFTSARNSSVGSPGGEDNFGYYDTFKLDFRKLRQNARRRMMVKETWIYCLPLRL